MKVVLREDVDKVGLRGEVVDVARGYARNFLLPRKLAEPATPARVKELEKVNARRALNEAQSVEQAQEIAQRLGQAELRFDVKAGETGVLFGSVTQTNLADAIWDKLKVRVDRKKIALDEPLKRIGRYQVPIELFAEVTVETRVLVVPEGGELPPEEEHAVAEVAIEEEIAAEEVVEEPEETEVAAEADAPAEGEPEPEPATPARVKELGKVNARRALNEAQTVEQAQEIAQRLGQAELRFDVKAGETGVLFGSVTQTNLADAIWDKLKVRVDRRKIGLDEPLKRIGRYQVPIELFAEVTVETRVLVVPEGGELPPEEELQAIEEAEAAEAAEAEALAEEEHAVAEVAIEEEIAAEEVVEEPEETDVAAEADAPAEGVPEPEPAAEESQESN